jgi:hypothetical protein
MSFWPPHAVGFFVSSDNIVRPIRRRENIVIGDDNGAVPLPLDSDFAVMHNAPFLI